MLTANGALQPTKHRTAIFSSTTTQSTTVQLIASQSVVLTCSNLSIDRGNHVQDVSTEVLATRNRCFPITWDRTEGAERT